MDLNHFLVYWFRRICEYEKEKVNCLYIKDQYSPRISDGKDLTWKIGINSSETYLTIIIQLKENLFCRIKLKQNCPKIPSWKVETRLRLFEFLASKSFSSSFESELVRVLSKSNSFLMLYLKSIYWIASVEYISLIYPSSICSRFSCKSIL